MDFPRTPPNKGKFVRYNVQKDNNILQLDRSFTIPDNNCLKLISENNIERMQRVYMIY